MNLILKEFLSIPRNEFVFLGKTALLEKSLCGVSIDSRTLRPGEIYFAIRGERLDGHDFVKDALQKKAVAVVVERSWWNRQKHDSENGVFLILEDTIQALQAAAN
jgi:UDP-N-acetylmuramoyl-tripeptide--D-alanyl-D-alanine ligase